MIEFIKILIEEPAKLLKFVLFIFKFLLNVCFAYVLYKLSIGTPTLLDYKDINGIFSFIVSGKILIPIILYAISEVFLFQILSELPILFLDRITKKVDLKKPDELSLRIISWVLKKTKIINVETEKNITLAGQNINILSDFLTLYDGEGIKDEIQNIRHSLVNKIMKLYFIFLIMYICSFNIYIKNSFFNYILFVLFIVLPLIYIGIHIAIDFLNIHTKDLQLGLDQLKFQKVIFDHLQTVGLIFTSLDDKDDQSPKYITYRNKDYFIQLYHYYADIDEIFLKSCTKLILDSEKNMILVTSNNLSNNAEELAMEYKNSLTIIKFENESDLVMKLNGFFKKK